MIYYGQKQLDREIKEHFTKHDPFEGTSVTKRGGFAIEVGAYDGVKGSNTKHFEEFHGWFTVLVEPNGKIYQKLLKNRPNSRVHKCACAASAGMREFTVVTMDSGIESSLSSLKIDDRLVDEYGFDIKETRTVTVECQTLDGLLNRRSLVPEYQPTIDFVSIDTEGTELDVLKGFDLDFWKPKLLVIENNYCDPEIEEYLKRFAYEKVSRNYVNDLYLRQYDL